MPPSWLILIQWSSSQTAHPMLCASYQSHRWTYQIEPIIFSIVFPQTFIYNILLSNHGLTEFLLIYSIFLSNDGISSNFYAPPDELLVLDLIDYDFFLGLLMIMLYLDRILWISMTLSSLNCINRYFRYFLSLLKPTLTTKYIPSFWMNLSMTIRLDNRTKGTWS
jgi:hypothetical protein